MPILDFGLELPPTWECSVRTLVFVATVAFLFVMYCCHQQTSLEVIQDGISETERRERVGARRKRKVPKKENGPPGKSTDEGEFKNSCSERNPLLGKTAGRGSLYPMKELEALNLDSSDSSEAEISENETLDPEKEADLDEEAARYEEERYHPDKHRDRRPLRRQPPTAPTAPPPYEVRPRVLSLMPERVRKKLKNDIPSF